MTARPFTPRRVFAGYLIGMLLVQAAWILAMPAFRGPDEFDHVYRAASVARGEWTPGDPAPHGRGTVVTVPRSIVHAASPVCRFYDYVGHDNCFPIKQTESSEAQVATAAGSYNPVYYAIVGSLARPFGGAAADYAMRIASAVICGLLIAWAAAITARWAATSWPLVMLSLGLTPVLVYSTSIAAPNGVTMSSAVVVWASLMGLSRAAIPARQLALPLMVGASALVMTHTTSIMWLAFIGLVAVLLRPMADWVRTVRKDPRLWTLAAVAVTTTTALCVAWTAWQHTNALGTKVLEEGAFPYRQLPIYHALWALQAIGAFPLRNDRAPVTVYAIWGTCLIAVIVALFRWGNRRERLAGALVFVLLAVVPTVLTVISYRTESVAWQGRYSLPLWLGITALAGLALDRRRVGLSRDKVGILFALLAVAMATSTVGVARLEIAHGPADPLAASIPGGVAVVALLAIVGAVVPVVVLAPRSTSSPAKRDSLDPTPIAT